MQDPWLSRHCRIAFAGKQPRPRRSGRIVANNCSYDVRRDQQGRAWLAVMTPTRGQRLRLNLGTLPHELVPTSTYQRIAARAERDCARGKARNKLRAMRERHLTRAAAATAAGDTAMARAAAAKLAGSSATTWAARSCQRNVSATGAVTKDAAYQAVHDLVDTTAHIVAEDLSGLRGKSKFGPTVSRAYAAWQRSFLADALASVPSRRGSAVTLVNPAYTSQQVHPCGHLGVRRGKNVYCQTAGCPQQGVVFDTEINAARNILARATDPQIGRYTPKHEVKRILIGRAGTVEHGPTTTQVTTPTGGVNCERNNLPPKRTTTLKK